MTTTTSSAGHKRQASRSPDRQPAVNKRPNMSDDVISLDDSDHESTDQSTTTTSTNTSHQPKPSTKLGAYGKYFFPPNQSPDPAEYADVLHRLATVLGMTGATLPMAATFETADNLYLCRLCMAKVVNSTHTTTNLASHLFHHHEKFMSKQEDLKDAFASAKKTKNKEPGRGQTDIRAAMAGPAAGARRPSPAQQAKFDEAVVRFLVGTNQSIRVVDDKNFRELIELAGGKFRLFGRTTMTKRIVASSQKVIEELQTLVKGSSSKFNIIMDGWTAGNQVQFFAITASFLTIDDQHAIHHQALLDFVPTNAKTGDEIAHLIKNVLATYNITLEQVVALTMDNASSNTKALDTLNGVLCREGSSHKIEGVYCLQHSTNRAAQRVIDILHWLVPGLRKLLSALYYSPTIRTALEKACNAAGIQYKVPRHDVRTRWNSTWEALNRLLELKPAILLASTWVNDERLGLLEKHHWDYVEEFVELLCPFWEYTQFTAAGVDTWTLPWVLPCYDGLMDTLDEFVASRLHPSDFARVDQEDVLSAINLKQAPADFAANPLLGDDAAGYVIGEFDQDEEEDEEGKVAEDGLESERAKEIEMAFGGVHDSQATKDSSAPDIIGGQESVFALISEDDDDENQLILDLVSVQGRVKEKVDKEKVPKDKLASKMAGAGTLSLAGLTPKQAAAVAAIACYGLILKHFNNTSDLHSLSTLLDPETNGGDTVKRWENDQSYFQVYLQEPLEQRVKALLPKPASTEKQQQASIVSAKKGVSSLAKAKARILGSGRNQQNPRPAGIDAIQVELGLLKSEALRASAYAEEDGKGVDSFAFWHGQRDRFPMLHSVAKDLLPIAGTSTSVERIFSVCRNILRHTRGRMSAQLFRATVLKKMAMLSEAEE